MQLEHRRWVARLVKLGLVAVAVLVVIGWFAAKRSRGPDFRVERGDHVDRGARGGRDAPPTRVERDVPAVDALGPGDLRIYNRDSTVNLILRGHEILAGLSPQMRAKIQQEITQSASGETTGFGGAIANMVRTTVASAIATHAAWSLRDIRDVEYRDGRIYLIRNDGRESELLGSVKTNDEKVSETFDPEDAQRFVEAVRARKRELR
jgi:hypothetical protein